MRSRSCALHSDSEQQFLKLAQASLDNSGLFYDEKVNRKIMTDINHNHAAPSCPQSQKTSPLKRQRSQTKNLYQNFDFSLEFQVARQEKQQLERNCQITCSTVNIGLITSNAQSTLTRLSRLLGMSLWEWQIDRIVDLVIWKKDRVIFKIWIFDKTLYDPKNALLELYTNNCKQIVDMEEVELQRKENSVLTNDLFVMARLLE